MTLHDFNNLSDEVNYATEANEIEFGFAFEAEGEDDRLPDYAMFVQLPGWMPAAE